MTTTSEQEQQPEEDHVGPKDAADILGIKVRTLKHWEQRGWITPIRLPNGYRRYSVAHLREVLAQRSKPADDAASA